ncbi:DUF3987 domain-containing protein [Shinella zoogloeoides]
MKGKPARKRELRNRLNEVGTPMNIAANWNKAKADAAAARTHMSDAASQAVAFLKLLDPDGWHNLVRIDPETRYTNGKTFAPGSWAEIAAYVTAWDGRENLYFSVNAPKPHSPDKKLEKTDIASIRSVFVDKDPDKSLPFAKGRAELEQFVAPVLQHSMRPSITLDSGGGFQFLWKLAEKLDARTFQKAAEDQGRGLAAAFDGDDVQNSDRILRLPGTKNLPDAKKRARGRAVSTARLVDTHEATFTLDGLAEYAPPREKPEREIDTDKLIAEAAAAIDLGAARAAVYYSDLPDALRSKFDKARAEYPRLDGIWNGDAGCLYGADNSKSGFRWSLAMALAYCANLQFTAQDFAELVHVWGEQTDALDEIDKRKLSRDWGRAAAPIIAERAGYFEEIQESTSDWPEPLDIFGDEDPMDLGNLPDNALPPIIDRFARSEARRKGVSLAFAASAAIGVTTAAIGSSLRIRVKKWDTGWTEPASLWLALVANPGRVKTPTISAATKPLQDIDGEFYRAFKAQHDLWTERIQANKKRKDGPSPGAEPIMRRTAVDDVTLEKQVRIHADNPRGILRTPDELMSFFGSFGAYKANGDGDRTQMLRLFDGGAIVHDRVGPGTIRAEQALMGIVAGTQPEKIAKAVRDLGADGMLQRFLFVLDDGKARKGVDEAPDERAANDYRALLRTLVTAEYDNPSAVRMDEAAQELFQVTAENINELKGLVGMPLAWPGHVEKWGKFFPRLVLTFHCIDMFASYGLTDPTLPVSRATVERAGNFARFLLRHSMTFYRQYFDLGQEAEESRWFAGYLLTHPEVDSVAPRTIYSVRKSLQGEAHKKLVVRIMKDLENAGWLRTAEQGTDGPARCSVNPTIHARFAARADWERRDREAKRAAIEKSAQAKRWLADETSGE